MHVVTGSHFSNPAMPFFSIPRIPHIPVADLSSDKMASETFTVDVLHVPTGPDLEKWIYDQIHLIDTENLQSDPDLLLMPREAIQQHLRDYRHRYREEFYSSPAPVGQAGMTMHVVHHGLGPSDWPAAMGPAIWGPKIMGLLTIPTKHTFRLGYTNRDLDDEYAKLYYEVQIAEKVLKDFGFKIDVVKRTMTIKDGDKMTQAGKAFFDRLIEQMRIK